MSFANLSPIWVVGGLAALAGVLFLLQRLRVRHQPVEVETMLFWQRAIEESRARTLVERFRHPWAYALVLLIASMLWLAFAGLRGGSTEDRQHLVLIDGSAAMSAGGRFESAKELALDYAESLPDGSRRVVLCGGRPRTMLRESEPAMLLSHRLAEVSAEACPNSVAEVLLDAVRASRDESLSVCVVGNVFLTESEFQSLPDTVEVKRLTVDGAAEENRGIVGLGVRAAIGGTFEEVDVLVDVLGADQKPQLSLDGVAAGDETSRETLSDGVTRFRYRLAAAGQELEVGLAGNDALGFDDRAGFSLPDRRPIPVAIEDGVPAAIRRVVAADPGLVERPGSARAAVRFTGSGFASGLPAIELSDPDASVDAFLAFHERDQDPSAVLNELYVSLGLSEIDATAAAESVGQTITMGASPADARSLWIWLELLDESYDFVHSRSFPLFVGLGLRWLVEFEDGPERVAVGDSIDLQDGDVLHSDGTSRSFASSFVPTSVGRFTPAAGTPFTASLIDPLSSGVPNSGFAEIAAASTTSARFDWTTLLLLIALLLLVVEWGLYRTSRMP